MRPPKRLNMKDARVEVKDEKTKSENPIIAPVNNNYRSSGVST